MSRIKEAARLLKKGEVVALPTETVYGLGASIASEEGIQKIFSLKGRPSDNPLIVHVSSIEMAKSIAHMDERALAFANAYWPGPVTLVLPKKEVSLLITAGLESVAVRMPRHPLALELIQEFGFPIAAPSANLSGRPSPTTAEHVRDDFGPDLFILDGGACQMGMESTVISLLEEKPVILRPGSLNLDFEEVHGKHLPSPGVRYKHYAPSVPIHLFKTKEELIAYAKTSLRSVYLAPEKLSLSLPFYPLEEKSYYATLRKVETGCDAILIYAPQEISRALRNRIEKGAQEGAFLRETRVDGVRR